MILKTKGERSERKDGGRKHREKEDEADAGIVRREREKKVRRKEK